MLFVAEQLSPGIMGKTIGLWYVPYLTRAPQEDLPAVFDTDLGWQGKHVTP